MQSSILSMCHTLIYLFQILILMVTNIQILTKIIRFASNTLCKDETNYTFKLKVFCDFLFLGDYLADCIFVCIWQNFIVIQ